MSAADSGDGHELAPQQRRLWTLGGGRALAPCVAVLTIDGPLVRPRLWEAIDTVVARHELLRTRLQPVTGLRLPVQVIASAGPVARVELEGPTDPLVAAPLPAIGAPPLQVALVRFAPERHALWLALPALLADAWTLRTLCDAIVDAYAGTPDAADPVQYVQFAGWQRGLLAEDAPVPDPAARALDSDRALLMRLGWPPRSDERARYVFGCPEGQVAALADLAGARGRSVESLLASAWRCALVRRLGCTELAIGRVVAGRPYAELATCLGLLAHVIPDLTRVDDHERFDDVWRATEARFVAQNADDSPPALARDVHLHAALTLGLRFLDAHGPRERAGCRFTLVRTDDLVDDFALALECDWSGPRLAIVHDPARVSALEVGRIAATLTAILGELCGDPALPGHALPAVGSEERDILLAAGTGPDDGDPHEVCLHRVFEAAARRFPDAIAVEDATQQLSFAGLDARASAWGRALTARGVGVESRVGLCVERSVAAIVGLLAVLKAGAAYVPLDPSAPPGRLAEFVAEAGLTLLLVDERLRDRLPPDGPPLLALDGPPPPTSGRPSATDLAAARVTPGNAAYVLFTSGSSGRPKGVVVEHRQIVHYVRAASRRLELPPRGRYATVSTLAADLGNTAIFPPLFGGGRLHILGLEDILDADALARSLAVRPIDVLKIVPSHLAALLPAGRAVVLPRDRLVLGGEAAAPELIHAIHGLAPALRLYNHYGPTEATVGAIAGELGPDDRGRVPLGRPLARTRARVLDRHGHLAPIGATGELYLGGAGLARGYLGAPARTAERFGPDPFMPGERLYRTGDRARVLADGRIEFLGRLDTQLKIRGHRVELGEIEAAIQAHRGVVQAVARAFESTPGEQRIAAYLALDPEVHAGRLTALRQSRVDAWRTVFGETHGGLEVRPEAPINPFGWDSSYTGEALPEEHVREQVEEIVARLLRWQPARVLEIGCGTGLVLLQLAPHCEHYTGTDIAEDVLRYTREMVAATSGLAARVELLRRPAHELGGLADDYDLVVVNSVAQYFPDVEYLVQVLAVLAARTRPGGRIFVGDVRSLRLLDAFHASVELFRAAADTPRERIRQRLIQQRSREGELVLDPDLFHALPRHIPAISAVEVLLKGGRRHNELTCFRYDVVLHVGPPPPLVEPVWRAWSSCGGLTGLAEILSGWTGDTLAVAEIPNARVIADVAVARRLRDRDGPATAADLRELARELLVGACDPEVLRDVAAAAGFELAARFSVAGRDACFDAVLRRRGAQLVHVAPREPPRPGALAGFASAPLLDELAAEIVPPLAAALRARLPDYMIPAAFVLLPALPRTDNGKLDVAALPEPAFDRPELGATYVAPRDPVEARVAEIWREVLHLDRIGVDDDFFELGGHSLLATQVVARLRRAFARELPLRTFFDRPTSIARLARVLSAPVVDGSEHEVDACDELGPRVGTGDVPVSHAQARMLSESDPTHPYHNIPFAFHLDGPLDVAALRGSLDAIMVRHEAWRTVFVSGERPGSHVQRVLPAAGLQLVEVDLSDLDGAAQGPAAQALAESCSRRRFDLERELPVRGVLIRLGPQRHALVLVVHHIVSDGWSTGVFCGELERHYAALTQGRPASLAPLALQYADYSAWQMRRMAGPTLERQLGYWLAHLAGRALTLELPTERPRPSAQTWRGAGVGVTLPPALARAAEALARAYDASLFIVLLTAYVALLRGISGQTDIGVGTPVANRTRVELEPLLGCFINFVVIQSDLRGDPSFLDLLAQVRDLCVRAYEHQDAPFHLLVDAFAPAIDPRRPPLFQVMFELANTPHSRRLELPGVTLSPLAFAHGTSEFEFNLILQREGEGLGGWLLYRTDLFSEAAAMRLFAGYHRLLAAVLAEPGLPLSTHLAKLPRWPDDG